MTLEEFYRRCDAIEPDENGCKLWPGDSRAQVRINSWQQERAYRLVLERKLDRTVQKALHSCDNSRCVNPDHIYEGTLNDLWKKKYQKDPEFRARTDASREVARRKSLEVRAGFRLRTDKRRELAICSRHHDTPAPAYVYVFPLKRAMGSNRTTGSNLINAVLRTLPYGPLCEQCYAKNREDIETAAEVVETWNLTRRLERYVKEGKE